MRFLIKGTSIFPQKKQNISKERHCTQKSLINSTIKLLFRASKLNIRADFILKKQLNPNFVVVNQKFFCLGLCEKSFFGASRQIII